MKINNFDLSLNQSCFSVQDSTINYCSGNKPATLLCLNEDCDNPSNICAEQSCECRKDHNSCHQILIQSIVKNIKAKIIPFQNIQEFILSQIEKTIDSVSDLREKMQTQMKSDLSLYGLTTKDKNVLAAVNQQKSTGKSLKKLYNQAISYENKYFQKKSLEQKFTSLWKPIETQIKIKSELLFQMLSDIKDNHEEKIDFRMFRNSKIQMTMQSTINLIKMFGDKLPQSAKLLYRASENYFYVDKFYEKCSKIPHTLTLCKTVYGKVIGGYTPLVWNTQKHGTYQKDWSGSSFIFSLTNNHKFVLKKNSYAVHHYKRFGPTFGSSHYDLCIYDQAHRCKSIAQINNAYLNENYSSEDSDSYLQFTGNPDNTDRFQAEEWEVWQMIFQ